VSATPFTPLSVLPTPLDEAPRLSAALGGHVLIKRDDLTGLAMGGNKARKLDHLLRDALEQGCDTLVTAGGAQSNFARMTAGAAAHLGLRCHLVLSGEAPDRISGNLVLDRLFGAELHFCGSNDWTVLEAEVARIAGEAGSRAYAMPIGGSTAVGALGYIEAADELMSQMESPPDWVVCAASSGGTLAGLHAGLPGSVGLLGIDVARPPAPLAERVPLLAAEAAALAGRTVPQRDLRIADHTGRRYAVITEECREAVRLAARTEGLVLDPVYSGKGMAGLIAAVREGTISGTIVFIHTGGAIALFADEYASF
jgi:D-cysteine desulfhydrase family pyridoxal phosphate-dependent enzyme